MDQRNEFQQFNHFLGLANISSSSPHQHAAPLTCCAANSSGKGRGNASGLFGFSPEVAQHVIDEYLAGMVTISSPTTIVLLALYTPMFLFSLGGNTLVIYLFFRSQHMRRLKSLFLVNLALADEAVTVVCVPLVVGQNVFRLWVYGAFMCKLTGYVQGMTVICSIFTLAALSVDHCMTVRCPRRDKRRYGRRQTALLLVGIWVAAAACVSPVLHVRQVVSIEFEPLNVSAAYCIEAWSSPLTRGAYSVSLLLFTYIAPIGVIVASYALVGRALCTPRETGTAGAHCRDRWSVGCGRAFATTSEGTGAKGADATGVAICGGGSDGSAGSEGGGVGVVGGGGGFEPRSRDVSGHCRHHCAVARPSWRGAAGGLAVLPGRRAIVRLLVVIVTVFALSWLPYNALSLSVDVSLDARHTRLLPFALWLGHAHSAINPVVYWFFNRTFRHCASNALPCSLLRRTRRDSRSSQYV